MQEIDWRDIDDRHLNDYYRRVALVETLLDENIDEFDRKQSRNWYIKEYGISERTVRNYLRRYREQGAESLLFYKPKGPSSPRVHDRRVREKILELIEERPSRTVPQLRRLIGADPELKEAVEQVSDRSIYRFLAEAGLTQKARREKEPRRRKEGATTSSKPPAQWNWYRETRGTVFGCRRPRDPSRCERPTSLPGLMIIRGGFSTPSIFGMRSFQGWRRPLRRWSCGGEFQKNVTSHRQYQDQPFPVRCGACRYLR